MSSSREAAERLFREEWGRVLAGLIRLLGDFDLAEEALQEAFAVAIERWPRDGVPSNPGGWITTTARNKAIDRVRRDRRLREKTDQLRALALVEQQETGPEVIRTDIPDDRLRLIFTCCHPALSMEARVALTLRTLGGLSTREIARAFLSSEPTVAQRLVRAKRKIRDAVIPYRVPPPELLPERLPGVLAVLYLIFNEGYASTFGPLVRTDLCEEAIRLARTVVELMPNEADALGLLALMLLQHSRRDARLSAEGELALLEDQDRARWDHEMIRDGTEELHRAMAAREPGPYQVQAAIAVLHAEAPHSDATDWPQIVALYGRLAEMMPTPVVQLNRAVAMAMADGPDVGLRFLDRLNGTPELEAYHLFHAARADLLRRMGRYHEASRVYERALETVVNPVEKAFLEKRLQEVLRSSSTRMSI